MDNQITSQAGISRRGLGRRVAASAAAAAIGQLRGAPPPPPPQTRNQGTLPAADEAEVDAKFADVVRKYGERLSEDQKTRIRSVITRHHRMLMRVRAFPIENGDSPATGLRLYPSDTKR